MRTPDLATAISAKSARGVRGHGCDAAAKGAEVTPRRWRLIGAALVPALGLVAAGAWGQELATRLEGAAGLVVQHKPAFPGSSDIGIHLKPGGFIRYGRISLTGSGGFGSGGFTTQSSEEVERGLAAEIARRDSLRVRLSLRLDRGRDESDSVDLIGMGKIRSTVRARLSARWDPAAGWRLSTGMSSDLLGHDGGTFADLGLTRQWSFAGGQLLTAGAGLTAADRRFLQTWHGVTAQQSLASGYAPYAPSAGLSEAGAALNWRVEFNAWGQRWGGFAGLGVSRLLGDAARSPLTRDVNTTVLSTGLVWRF